MIEIAKNHNGTPTKRKDISDVQGIPNSYLENILITLKHNRIVSSIRGVGGGFVLKRAPEEITLLEIFEALQGDLNLLDCIEMPEICDRNVNCIIRPIWVEVQKAQKEVLRKVTIKDLMDKEKSDIPEYLGKL